MVDVKSLPDTVIHALEGRGYVLNQIAKLTPQEIFNEYCHWHGLIDWGNNLWRLVETLKKTEVKP